MTNIRIKIIVLLIFFSFNAFSKQNKKEIIGTRPILKINLSGTSNKDYLNNIKSFLDIYKEQNNPIKAESYIEYLINIGGKQIKKSLQPFGYYLSKVKTDVTKTKKLWKVNYKINLDKPTITKKWNIKIIGDGKNNQDLIKIVKNHPLKKGEILVQKQYTDFKNKLISMATTDGYFDAKFIRKQIILSDDFSYADIFITYDTGKRYKFGNIKLKQNFLNQNFINRYKLFNKGKYYSSKDTSSLLRDLYNSDYINIIDVIAIPNKKEKTIPVTFKITAKKNKKHTFGLGYGTDSGFRARYDFDWRWVNRLGHQFKSNIFVSQKKFTLGGNYKIPGLRPANDDYRLFANLNRKWPNNNKKSTLWNIGALYNDVNGRLSRKFGIKWQKEKFSIGNITKSIGLLTPYINFTYRNVDNPLGIKDGFFIETSYSAASKKILSDMSFFQLKANVKYIKTIANTNRIKIAAGTGITWTKDFYKLPLAYRFFTGGDGTVRGYKFKSIGNKNMIGGNKMYFFGAEYEYLFNKNMGVAIFTDIGNAYYQKHTKPKRGAGIGFHYYSPIGPIKIDIAHGFDKPSDKIMLHLSIGPEF